MGWIKGILDQFGRAQVVQYIFSLAIKYALPVILASLAGFSGYAGGAALMWIMMACALTAAGISHTRYVLTEHQIKNSPSDKLRLVSAITSPTLVLTNRESRRNDINQRHISELQIGVLLQNISHFPISIIVESANTECNGKKPPRITYPLPAFELLPNNVAAITDGSINMEGTPCQAIECILKISIRYGKRGKEKYKMSFNGKVTANIQPNGQLLGNYIQWDPPVIGKV